MAEVAGAPGLAAAGTLLRQRDAVLVGCWWLLREIELAVVQVDQVAVLPGIGRGEAILDLPVDKTDPQGKGEETTPSLRMPWKQKRTRMRVIATEQRTLRYHVFVTRQITQTKLEPSAKCNLETQDNIRATHMSLCMCKMA